MPITKHAAKDMRQAAKRLTRNRLAKTKIKTLLKDTRAAVAEKKDEKEKLLKESIKMIDKAIQKGILHKNTGARKKSRLMKAYNKK
jgi:small subunit ribosomal protein S20